MLKHFPKWQKVLLTIITMTVLIRIGYIFINDEIDKEYYADTLVNVIETEKIPCVNVVQEFRTNRERLDSLEFRFSEIAEDKAGKIVLQITADDNVVYQANISLINVNNDEWKRVWVNVPLNHNAVYKIMLNAEECTQIPCVYMAEQNTAVKEAVVSSVSGIQMDGNIAIRYGYLQVPSLLDKMQNSFMWLLFLTVFIVFFWYFDKIKNLVHTIYTVLEIKGEVALAAVELILCLLVIDSSGIEFQDSTKIIFCILSSISVWDLKNKISYIIALANEPWKRICLYILYLYSAFSLVGQRILIYPLNQKVTFVGLFVLLIALIWLIPIIISVMFWMDRFSAVIIRQNNRMESVKFSILLIVFLLLPAVLNLYANNPGITSADTYNNMIVQARNIRGMFDYHPAFYAMVLKVIISIWDSTYAVILAWYFFWCYVMMEVLFYLRKKGIGDGILLAVALFLGGNAGNFLHLNTIWKDIPYTLSVIWVIVILGKISLDFEIYKKKWYIYIELIIALTGVFFYRKNGIVTFVIVAAAMIIILRKNIRALYTLGITAVLIMIIKYPVYNYFEIQDSGRYGMYIGLSQDILGVYYSNGEVSEDTLKMINVMTSNNTLEYAYTPTRSYSSYALDVEPKEFIFNYIDTFVKNPIIMSRAVIARMDAAWDIFAGQDTLLVGTNYTDSLDNQSVGEEWTDLGGEWTDYYPKRKYNSFYAPMLAFTTYTTSNQWIDAIEWRCGLFTLLGLITISLCLFKKGKGKYWIVVIPAAGHIISLLLSTGWADFRYFWPLNLANLFIMLYLMVVIADQDKGRSAE